jgi:hypothetical protein
MHARKPKGIEMSILLEIWRPEIYAEVCIRGGAKVFTRQTRRHVQEAREAGRVHLSRMSYVCSIIDTFGSGTRHKSFAMFCFRFCIHWKKRLHPARILVSTEPTNKGEYCHSAYSIADHANAMKRFQNRANYAAYKRIMAMPEATAPKM